MCRTTSIVVVVAAVAVSLGGLTAHSSSSGKKNDGKAPTYYLSFKPEVKKAWKRVVAEYKKKTGIGVKTHTAVTGNYEQTLRTGINKSGVPTLFNVNDLIGLKNWKKYVSDLSDEKLAEYLTKKDLALRGEDGKIYGVPFTTEDYGTVYNDAIVKRHFALPDAKMRSIGEIKSFNKFRGVAKGMQIKKDQPGIEGAFASMSFASEEDWHWHTHLANYSFHYELKGVKIKDTDTLKGAYLDNYKKIFDLYLKSLTVFSLEASNKSVSGLMSEFAHGQAVMTQNGNWAWEQIKGDKGNTVRPEDVHFLPTYTGVKGKKKNGIAVGTENYLTLNSKVPEANEKASIDFVNWLYTTKEDTRLVSEDLGFIAPFDIFASQSPSDLLGKEVAKYIDNKNLDPVAQGFMVFPSEDYKKQLGSHPQQYATGREEWSDIAKYSTSEWKKGKEQNKDS